MLDTDELPDQLDEATEYLHRLTTAAEAMRRSAAVIAWSVGILAGLSVSGVALTVILALLAGDGGTWD